MSMSTSATQREELLSELENIVRAERQLAARRMDVIARALQAATHTNADAKVKTLSGPKTNAEVSYRSLRAEIAAILRVTEFRADTELGLASSLTADYPDTLAALRDGEIDLQHAKVISKSGTVIHAAETMVPPVGADGITSPADALAAAVDSARDSEDLATEHRAIYERAVLEFAREETPNRLTPIAERLAEQWSVESIDERHHRERQHRRVIVNDREDGMADLVAYLPALEAHAIKHRLTDLAKSGQRQAKKAARARAAAGETALDTPQADTRTLDERRADALATLILRDAAGTPDTDEALLRNAGPVKTQVQITVRAEAIDAILAGTATGGSTTLGTRTVTELVGYGPISLTEALASIGEAKHWNVAAVRTCDGQVLSVDSYRVPAVMHRELATRDLHCRFPGCRAPVYYCDLDHTIPASEGGPTATNNLAFLCRGHHTMKHHGGWRVKQVEGGVLQWTTPSGRSLTDRPPNQLPELRATTTQSCIPKPKGRGQPRRQVRFESPAEEPF